MEYVLIIGAKSDIAKAIARKWAAHGYHLYLAARNAAQLEDFAKDLRIRTQQEIRTLELDILDLGSHQDFYKNLDPKPIGVITAVGYLGAQEKAQQEMKEAKKIIDTNFTGLACFLNHVALDFESRHSGFIAGISSVAGDRGRKSNYFYGAAKAAFSAYLAGLRNRLHASNVHVLTVKPGYVDTSMTEGMELPKLLTAQPHEVANDVFKAIRKKKNVIYSKWFWKWIMLIIKWIPEWQFKKMNF